MSKLAADLHKLAEVAKVPASARPQFFQDVKSAIEQAHQLAGMNWSRPKTAKSSALLKGIAANAEKLAKKIQTIRKQAGKFNKEDYARMHFAGALHDKQSSISDALTALKTISESAGDAAKEVIKLGHPGGTTPAFDGFATKLYLAARRAGGDLTIYKSAGSWAGSFLKAFSILKSHLPQKYFSPSGRVLDRIARPYRHFRFAPPN